MIAPKVKHAIVVFNITPGAKTVEIMEQITINIAIMNDLLNLFFGLILD
jgi:hypothetical protein